MSEAAVAAGRDWMVCEVRIHCNTGEKWRTRSGWQHADAPGLAVTPCEYHDGPDTSLYRVTHLLTGFKIGDCSETLEDAQRRALMLGVIGVGDLDEQEVKAKPVAWRAVARLLADAPLEPVAVAAGYRSLNGENNG